MMKCRQKLLAAGLILCIAVTGCAGQDKAGDAAAPSSGAVSQAEGQESSAAESGAQIPNPMEEVKDILAFEDLGIHMVLPEKAKDAQFFLISQAVADVEFTLDGISYSYRASRTAEDFAGIFERFEDSVITEKYGEGEQSTEVTIKTTQSGGRLASWSWGETDYTLYTSSQMEDEAITQAALELAGLSQYEEAGERP